MEYSLLIVLLIIIWVNLHNKISKHQAKVEELMKEIGMLKSTLEKESADTQEAIAPKPILQKEEEYHIPILSIEESPEKEESPTIERIPQKEKKSINYEKYIGENLFAKVGVLILVVGIGLFVKYAIDQDWINEIFRTVLGFATGIGLLLIAAKLKDKYRTFSSLLSGGAFAIFYVTVAMAYHYYGLFSQSVAFILLVSITGFMSTLSLLYERRELAIIALLGGFIAPFLVSEGTGSYGILFTYVMILNLGMFGLSIYRKWGELPVICFILTWLVLGGYTYSLDSYLLKDNTLLHLLCFSTAFYLLFLLSVIPVIRINAKKINQYLLGIIGLNNFVFLFFALWFLRDMELTRNCNGGVTLFIAITNLILFFLIKRKGDHFIFLMHTLLGITLLFVSITIPIQLNGTFITLFWASEAMLVLWFYNRFRLRVYQIFAAILPVLTLGSYGMDLIMLNLDPFLMEGNRLFVNGLFATGIFTGLSYWFGAWLLREASTFGKVALLLGCAVLYIAFVIDMYQYIEPTVLAFSYIELFTVVALLLANLALGRTILPVSGTAGWYGFLLGIGMSFFVAMSAWINKETYPLPIVNVIIWLSFLVLAGHIFVLAKQYYKAFDIRDKRANGMTVYVCLLASILLVTGVNNLLNQLELPDELSAGLSISLSIAGFIQMAIGMRQHVKIVRLVSLATFSFVLLKLVMIDLWLLPTIGKVVVFIMLGVILLVLSFLYQKLKAVLFDDGL